MVDQVYANFIQGIMLNGKEIQSRNSMVRRRRNFINTFETTPLVSLRKVSWMNALREMEWFLSGSTNIQDLHKDVHPWWAPWVTPDGEVTNGYSKQFRRYNGTFDQIAYMIKELRNNPYSRRTVIGTWNTSDMVSPDTLITNCHGSIIQAFVERSEEVEPTDGRLHVEKGALHLTMYQRSADMIVGVPHNWIQYWALLMWLAKQTSKEVGTLTWIGGDCHIYEAHYNLANTLTSLDAEDIIQPQLLYSGSLGDTFKADDFKLNMGYHPLVMTKAKLVV